MKLLIALLALALTGTTACQQPTPPLHSPVSAEAPVAKPNVAKSATATTPVSAAAARSADTLTTAMLALLRDYDLAPLWSNSDKADSISNGSPVLEGFLGPDRYRIALALTQVRRDSANPALLHVQGKSRYKKQVVPFSGTIEIRRLTDLKSFLDLAPEDSLARSYTAESHFVLCEDRAAKNAGVFEGTGLLDFYITPRGVLGQIMVMAGQENPARGQGVILRGKWTSNHTKQQKDLLVARDVFRIAPDVLTNFGIGERSGEINPKYAKLGWTEVWENEEWWAEPGVMANL